jgi:head-tail adaptor
MSNEFRDIAKVWHAIKQQQKSTPYQAGAEISH